MSPIERMLQIYIETRGIEMPDADAEHLIEEAGELRDALDVYSLDDPSPVWHEIADVVLGAACIAYWNGTTVEACIAAKIEYDRGRGPKL